MKPNLFRHRLLVLVGIALALGVALRLTAQTQTDDGWVLALPKRSAAGPPPVTLPELATAAHTVTPATITLAVQGGAAGNRPARQTITRTAERIHVAREDGREWLFERNPIDPRRVSAVAVEHASHEVVLYADSDLRMMMGIRGWADVLTLGFDQERLAHHKPTATTRRIGVVTFTRYASTSDRRGAGADIWWNGQQQLASDFTVSETTGTARFILESISSRINTARLQPPAKRFPTYTVINVADWLERH